jgi:hypothetical protein
VKKKKKRRKEEEEAKKLDLSIPFSFKEESRRGYVI